jgi:hypothetical protein
MASPTINGASIGKIKEVLEPPPQQEAAQALEGGATKSTPRSSKTKKCKTTLLGLLVRYGKDQLW